jgi:hypothetical protein
MCHITPGITYTRKGLIDSLNEITGLTKDYLGVTLNMMAIRGILVKETDYNPRKHFTYRLDA